MTEADQTAPVLTEVVSNLGDFYPRIKLAADGSRYVALCPFIFTWAILAGTDDVAFDDRWCFHDSLAAFLAFEEWDGRAGTEPEGWHRHIPSGRRRKNGNPREEYVLA